MLHSVCCSDSEYSTEKLVMTYSETWLPTPARIDDRFTAVWMLLLSQIDTAQIDTRAIGPGRIDTGALFDLSRDERAYAARLASASRRHEFVVGRRLLRAALARTSFSAYTAADITNNAHGKPQIAPAVGLDFNLSHSGDVLVLVLSAQGPIGVDVESLERQLNVQRLAKRFCHPAEQAWLDRLQPVDRHRAFLEFWVRKEAVLKARGDGVHGYPSRVDAISQMEASSKLALRTTGTASPIITRGVARYQHESATHVASSVAVKPTPNEITLNEGLQTDQRWHLHRLPVVVGYIGWLAGEAAPVDIGLYDGRALLKLT